ncbi:hypothetical protein [Aeoliella sp.]|uniref:hypothetical protein n=1 Tax=Aeoliella sp. TaxID=2795800 RepID=UPI003CCBCF24
MKSEERHELETNSLAKLLTTAGEKLGPYSSYIVYGVLGVAALWAIISLTTNSVRSKKDQQWDSYTIATLPGKYDALALRTAADEHSGEAVGELADMAWADGQLAEGCRSYFSNKQQAIEALDAAATTYKQLIDSASDDVLKSRAQLGLAKALEAKGEIAEAIDAYNKVTGTFSEIADARVTELEAVDAASYGDWLARAQGASMPSFGRGGMPGFSPDSLNLPGSDADSTRRQGEMLLDKLNQFQNLAPESKGNRYDDMPADDEGPKVDPFADIPSPEATEPAAGEGPAMEEPSSEEPAAEESATEESVTEEPATEEPKE